MEEAPRMDKVDVRGLIGRPNVSIIDVRSDADWQKSDSRVVGAIRENGKDPESWAHKYDKSDTLILYCS